VEWKSIYFDKSSIYPAALTRLANALPCSMVGFDRGSDEGLIECGDAIWDPGVDHTTTTSTGKLDLLLCDGNEMVPIEVERSPLQRAKLPLFSTPHPLERKNSLNWGVEARRAEKRDPEERIGDGVKWIGMRRAGRFYVLFRCR
jgi:hypothetical protein